MHLSGSKIGITFDQLHETNWNFQGQPGQRWEKACGILSHRSCRARKWQCQNAKLAVSWLIFFSQFKNKWKNCLKGEFGVALS